MSKRFFNILALLMVASLVLAACGGGAAECSDELGCVDIADGDPVHISFMLPETGAANVYGISAINAIEIAAADFGDVLGHEILITGEDSLCSAEGGETASQRVAADPTIVGVIGTTCSSAMTAAMTTISQAGLTIISPSNTGPALTNPDGTWAPGYFRTAHNDLFQGAIAARYAFEELGVTTVAAIHDGTPYTEGLASSFTNSFVGLGGTVTTTEAVNVGDTDMRAVLTTIGADAPGVLFFPIFQPEGDFIAAQSVEIAGLEDTILFGADGLLVAPFAPSAGEAALGMYMSGPYLSGEREDAYQAAFLAHYGDVPPGPFGEHAYDGMMILLNAIAAVAQEGGNGSLSIGRQALRDAVTATDGHDGITGVLSCGDKELIAGQPAYKGDCATGEALGIFQVTADWVASEDGYPVPVIWQP